MIELLYFLVFAVVATACWRAISRTRDPLGPMVVFAPMLLYMYAYNPWLRYRSGQLSVFFPSEDDLMLVALVLLASVVAFSVGLSWRSVPTGVPDRRFALLPYGLPRRVRVKLFRIAIALGIVANSAFWYMIYYSGGWSHVFRHAKPFLSAPSGYIGELPMLVYPSLLLLAISWQGRRVDPQKVCLAVLVAFPQITMATFGGRRGPMFLVVVAFAACWCIINSKRPKMRTILMGAVVLGAVLFLLGKNRSNLFRPWDHNIEFSGITERLAPTDPLSTGEEFVAGAAMIVGSNRLGYHFWGARFLTTLFVRPIPGFLWSTKYRDVGMEWMEYAPGSSGLSDSEWLSCIGFIPAGGNAGGFIADLFLEFSWGGVLMCYLVGRAYSECWLRWRTRGGLWVLIYFEMLLLTIYLPSQSVGAWLYRLIIMIVPTLVIWKRVIEPGATSRSMAGVRRVHNTRTAGV